MCYVSLLSNTVPQPYLGLKEDDPRLAKMFFNLKRIQKQNEKSKLKTGIDFEKFRELISEEKELELIKKAFTGTVARIRYSTTI